MSLTSDLNAVMPTWEAQGSPWIRVRPWMGMVENPDPTRDYMWVRWHIGGSPVYMLGPFEGTALANFWAFVGFGAYFDDDDEYRDDEARFRIYDGNFYVSTYPASVEGVQSSIEDPYPGDPLVKMAKSWPLGLPDHFWDRLSGPPIAAWKKTLRLMANDIAWPIDARTFAVERMLLEHSR